VLQPLDPTKGEVKLVDPNDEEACDAEWVFKDKKWTRVSKTTGFAIPVPSRAFVTYDYASKKDYIESPKDTPMKEALRYTYEPELKTFEQSILDELQIKEDRTPAPTYWY